MKMDSVLNNQQRLMCYKTNKQTMLLYSLLPYSEAVKVDGKGYRTQCLSYHLCS